MHGETLKYLDVLHASYVKGLCDGLGC